MWADTILIVFISICTALLGEGKEIINYDKPIDIYFTFYVCFAGLTWLMVYRTEKYQKLKAEVEKQSKKCKF